MPSAEQTNNEARRLVRDYTAMMDASPATTALIASKGGQATTDYGSSTAVEDIPIGASDHELSSPPNVLRGSLTANFRVGYLLSIAINFGLNYWIAWAFYHRKEDSDIGLFKNLPGMSAAMYFDMLVTSFLLVYLSSLLTTPGVHSAIKKGQLLPVPNADLDRSIWAYFPCRTKSPWARAFYFAFEFALIYGAVSIIIMQILCSDGDIGGGSGNCSMSLRSYIWFKAAWCGGLALVAYPFLYMASLNRALIDDSVYDGFLETQGWWKSNVEQGTA